MAAKAKEYLLKIDKYRMPECECGVGGFLIRLDDSEVPQIKWIECVSCSTRYSYADLYRATGFWPNPSSTKGSTAGPSRRRDEIGEYLHPKKGGK